MEGMTPRSRKVSDDIKTPGSRAERNESERASERSEAATPWRHVAFFGLAGGDARIVIQRKILPPAMSDADYVKAYEDFLAMGLQGAAIQVLLEGLAATNSPRLQELARRDAVPLPEAKPSQGYDENPFQAATVLRLEVFNFDIRWATAMAQSADQRGPLGPFWRDLCHPPAAALGRDARQERSTEFAIRLVERILTIIMMMTPDLCRSMGYSYFRHRPVRSASLAQNGWKASTAVLLVAGLTVTPIRLAKQIRAHHARWLHDFRLHRSSPWLPADRFHGFFRGGDGADAVEASRSKDFGRYSDDDESCTTEGLSPGVCALSSLARPLASKRLRKPVADCDENESREGLARAMLERALVAKIEAGLVGNHSGFDTTRLQSLEKDDRHGHTTWMSCFHCQTSRAASAWCDGRQPPDHKEALRSRVAGHLLELLERKVGAQGLNLKTLAVFVATLEHLLHGDERQRLKQSWTVHDLNPEDLTDAEGLQSDGWSKIRNDIRNGIKTLRATRGTDLSFEDAVQVADQVLEYFRDVSGSMCRDMAESLVRMPGGKQGKVPLSEMRKKDLFRETMDYLRAANALDESTRDPVVLVPNYMLGPSNCFYDLCCPDPCEGQRAFFEEAVMDGQPAVAIEQIAREQGASSRMLPKLHQLLERQAALHGHDFSMWFHEAFPDRCPRPLKGDAVPDAKAEFQATAQVESLFEW
eukprot:g27655.t1